jgi:hypothetical protein
MAPTATSPLETIGEVALAAEDDLIEVARDCETQQRMLRGQLEERA